MINQRIDDQLKIELTKDTTIPKKASEEANKEILKDDNKKVDNTKTEDKKDDETQKSGEKTTKIKRIAAALMNLASR